MSLPVALFAKIRMSETAAKGFIQKHSHFFIDEIIATLTLGDTENYFMCKYLKKDQALYCVAYFEFGDAHLIEQCSINEFLAAVPEYSDIEGKSFYVATLDALNFGNLHFYKVLSPKGWVNKTPSEAESKTIWGEAQKLFFKYASDSRFWEDLETSKPLLHPDLKKLLNKKINEHSNQILTAKLKQASPRRPVEVTNKYFYNGRHLYYLKSERFDPFILDQVDLQSLKLAPWGLQDKKAVYIDGTRVETNPEKFKRMIKGNDIYYRDETNIYNRHLDRIDIEDPSSFKLVAEFVAEDKVNLYFDGIKINKAQLGIYRFSEGLNVSALQTIIFGEKQIWVGGHHISEVDARTFKLVRLPDLLTRIYETCKTFQTIGVSECVLPAEDKDGPVFVVVRRSSPAANSKCFVFRHSPQEFLTWYEKDWHERQLKSAASLRLTLPTFSPQDDPEAILFSDNFLLWFARYFPEQASYFQSDFAFLRAVNNFLFGCWSKFKKTGKSDTSSLLAGLQVVDQLSQIHLNPSIYHHLACFYCATGNLARAAQAIEDAFYFGYLNMHQMLNDEDLSGLKDDKNILNIKSWLSKNVGQNIQENTSWKWEQNLFPYPFLNSRVLKMLGSHYFVSSTSEVIDLLNSDPSFKDYLRFIIFHFNFSVSDKEMTGAGANWGPQAKYNEEFKLYLNGYFQHSGFNEWHENNFYEVYKDKDLFDMESLLARLRYAFWRFHDSSVLGNYDSCIEILQKIERMSEAGELSANQIENLKANPLYDLIEKLV